MLQNIRSDTAKLIMKEVVAFPELLILDEGNDSDEITADPQQGEDKSSNGSKKGQGGGEVDSS